MVMWSCGCESRAGSAKGFLPGPTQGTRSGGRTPAVGCSARLAGQSAPLGRDGVERNTGSAAHPPASPGTHRPTGGPLQGRPPWARSSAPPLRGTRQAPRDGQSKRSLRAEGRQEGRPQAAFLGWENDDAHAGRTWRGGKDQRTRTETRRTPGHTRTAARGPCPGEAKADSGKPRNFPRPPTTQQPQTDCK